jgi:chromosome segregation ATPase
MTRADEQWEARREVLDRWFEYGSLTQPEQQAIRTLMYETRAELTIQQQQREAAEADYRTLAAENEALKRRIAAMEDEYRELAAENLRLVEEQPIHEGKCSPVDAVRAARWQEALDAAYFALDRAAEERQLARPNANVIDYWLGRAMAHASIANALRQ